MSGREVSLAIVGSGGAGVMTTGELLLATAASCGLYGLMTTSYGPQIRGGESACFLRLGVTPFEKQADELDLLVAFDWRNVDRFQEELSLKPEAWLLYEETAGDPPAEFSAITHRFPVEWKASAGQCAGGRGRLNIFILGALCCLLGLTQASVRSACEDRFRDMGREVLDGNDRLLHAAWRWAEHAWKTTDFRLPVDGEGPCRWILTGNQGIVIGSLAAGCEFYAGYPITPSSDIMEDLSHYLPQRGGVVIQAEDELAAVNMAIGASFGGKKTLTATSGPGFSLMAEGLGLALMAEIPLVVVDVQRVGPSTGIATKTEQSDLWAALGSSHGDNPRVVLAPSSIRGCVEMTVKAFNIAESYRVPVILLSDQFLGGRTQIMDPLPLDSLPVRARPVAGVPGTAVAPMALPGMPGGEYTAESTEHDAHGRPVSSYRIHKRESERRLSKLDALASEEGWIEVCGDLTAQVGLIGWGSTGGVVREVVRAVQATGMPMKGIVPHLLLPPQPEAMHRILEGIEVLYVAELSSMGQFHRYLRSCYGLPSKVVSIARGGGMPFRTSEVLAAMELQQKQPAISGQPEADS